jgi:hypothetical protein
MHLQNFYRIHLPHYVAWSFQLKLLRGVVLAEGNYGETKKSYSLNSKSFGEAELEIEIIEKEISRYERRDRF